jgi:hypothetical protein
MIERATYGSNYQKLAAHIPRRINPEETSPIPGPYVDNQGKIPGRWSKTPGLKRRSMHHITENQFLNEVTSSSDGGDGPPQLNSFMH